MTRTIRTLLLSAIALGALATAAIAAPGPLPMSGGASGGIASMHAVGATQMHTASGGMTQMHAAMMTDPMVHDSMLDDPTMQAHMTAYGVDVDQLRRSHDDGRSIDQIHATLAEQGIDTEAMQADCPMTNMHGDGGLHADDHHSTWMR